MVKVLVATSEGQGARHDDYFWAVDGELVSVPVDRCDCPGCGCGRGFAGLASGRSTTTALVVERLDLGPAEVSALLSDSLVRQGWLRPDHADDDELFRHLFGRLLVAAAHFPPGSIVEREGNVVRRRAQTEPFQVPSEPGPDSDTAGMGFRR